MHLGECMATSFLKIAGYIGATILLFFGVLFLWASSVNENPGMTFITGMLMIIIGFAMIGVIKYKEPEQVQIIQKIDLPGKLDLETLKCKNCGATLDNKTITVSAGAVIISCPYCNTTYEISEVPKW